MHGGGGGAWHRRPSADTDASAMAASAAAAAERRLLDLLHEATRKDKPDPLLAYGPAVFELCRSSDEHVATAVEALMMHLGQAHAQASSGAIRGVVGGAQLPPELTVRLRQRVPGARRGWGQRMGAQRRRSQGSLGAVVVDPGGPVVHAELGALARGVVFCTVL